MSIAAKYERGIFRPLEDVSLQEGTIVEVLLPGDAGRDGAQRALKGLTFYGVWSDRETIPDDSDYVERTLENPRR